MAHALTVSLSPSCIETLMAAGGEEGDDPGRRLAAAVAYFLDQMDAGAAGIAYPDFRRGDDAESPLELELVIAVGLWRRFTAEANRQGVPAERLLEHAAIFLAAQADAGRLAERIAGELDQGQR